MKNVIIFTNEEKQILNKAYEVLKPIWNAMDISYWCLQLISSNEDYEDEIMGDEELNAFGWFWDMVKDANAINCKLREKYAN